MKRIWILGYRADRQDGHWLDDAIAIATKLPNWNSEPISHAEGVDVDAMMCFSSTLRDGAKGVRWEDFETVTRNKWRWEVLQKWVTDKEYEAMSQRAAKVVGKKYFVVGLFTDFFLPLGWLGAILQKILDQFYCSLVVQYWVLGIIKRISPRRMFSKKWMKKNGWIHLGNLADIIHNPLAFDAEDVFALK